ncbi:hypothetical protein, partial [Endozoicomonas sp. SESOKO3]
MQDSNLRSALQLQKADYQMLEQRISSSGLPAEDRDRLLLDIGSMKSPPDQSPATGRTPSNAGNAHGKKITPNSPGALREVPPGSYDDSSLKSRIAILFSAEYLKYARENDVPDNDMQSLEETVTKTLRWLRTTTKYKAFSSALNEGRSQVFGNLQTLVDKGLIDGSAGSGFNQVKIPDSVRLLLVVTPPGSADAKPVLVNNAGSVLKIDPSQTFSTVRHPVLQYYALSGLITDFIVATNQLKGISSNTETIQKNILHELGVDSAKRLQDSIKSPEIPEDIHKGRIGLEIEYDDTTVDFAPRKRLAYTEYDKRKLFNPDYNKLSITTDDNYGLSVIEIVTGPEPLSVYSTASSALFRATNTIAAVLVEPPESDLTVHNIVKAYNDKLLGKNPTDDLKEYRLFKFTDVNPKISLRPSVKGITPLPYHLQVNFGVELSSIGDTTSYIPSLMVPKRTHFLRGVFERCQYEADKILEKLDLNSDLLRSTFTAHLYKQTLDSSTKDFMMGKIGPKDSPITQLEGLLRLGTADFLM